MRRKIHLLNPWVMATGFLTIFLVIYVVHYAVVRFTGSEMDVLQIWTYVMGAALVYAIFSTINILYAKDTARYYYVTLMAFAALVGAGVLLATWISGQGLLELETYRKVFIFVVFTFLALVSIVSFMKRLENWSRQKDDKFLNQK